MNPTVKKHCLKIMDELIAREIADIFVEPVDPVLDGCPDYFDVILNPMDLTTCKTKLEKNKYETLQEWKDDVNLIWSNAILFNGSESIIGIIAQELQDVFNEYTKFFTESPSDDWITQLNSICEDFSQEVKALTIVNPYTTRKSPSLMTLTPAPSDIEDLNMSHEDIVQLGEEIKNLSDQKSIQRMFDCLKSMEPTLVGDRKGLTINICELPHSTLIALREELDSIMRGSEH